MSGFPLRSAWKTPRVWLPGSRLTPCRGGSVGDLSRVRRQRGGVCGVSLLASLLTATRNFLNSRARFRNVNTFSVHHSLASSDRFLNRLACNSDQDILYMAPLRTGLLAVS